MCYLLRATKNKSDSSMIAVLIYMYMVRVVLLRVCSQFYYVKELCNICAFCSYNIITHTT